MIQASKIPAAPHAWASFWDESGLVNSRAVHGERQAAILRSHWEEAFRPVLVPGCRLRMLDVACGAGVISRTAMACARDAGAQLEIHCSDYAHPALVELAARQLEPPVFAAAGDAARLPYKDGGFDIVASQYGLEYAGQGAFAEAGRVTAEEGLFLAVVHKHGGAIQRECQGNLDVLTAVEENGLLRHFRRYMKMAAKVGAGTAAPKALERPMKDVASASDAVAAVLLEAAPGSARDHVQRLLGDMRQLDQRRRNYNTADIERWIEGQTVDLAAFRVRMESMVGAALDASAMADAVEQLKQAGLEDVTIADLVMDPASPPAGWTLRAAGKTA